MASPLFRGVLLCEDVEHERFFRRLLERKWFRRNQLKAQRIPNAQGAGDAFVRSRYAGEVQLARSKRHENYALIVVVDGDRWGLAKRIQQLDEQLDAAGLDKRNPSDKILVFVPTRNIETWKLWLCGHRDLDEEGDYKGRFRKADMSGTATARDAIEAWFQQLSTEDCQLEEQTLPALAAGRQEIQRLKTNIR